MPNLFTAPFADLFDALDRIVAHRRVGSTLLLLAACAASWWVYVPIHELMHAWGAMLGGATVTRLDIGEAYGARFLQRMFPYVRVGSDYAGQLVGFDTHGNDATYALCVFFPFLLTIAIGVPLLLRAAASDRPAAALLVGAALPWAWAPMLSIAGDFYELGSIAMSRSAAALFAVDGHAWRGDDISRVFAAVFKSPGPVRGVDVIGVTGSFALGVVLAFATYAIGRALGRAMDRAPTSKPARTLD